jgi:nucleotide-binding universal stress UspA family protein
MKKFIAAFDGLNFSESTMSYAIDMSKTCDAHLVGVFLEDFMRRSYSVTDITRYEGSDFDRHMHELDEKDREDRQGSIEVFRQACGEAGINFSVHRDRNVAIQELLHESIYADLIIISPRETITRYEESPPTRFIRELLGEVQCPVVLVPPGYEQVNKVILLYDGEPSSVYAVKTFSYLFEAMKGLETEVLTVKAEDENLHLPDNRLIKEFIKRHYPKAAYITLRGFPEDEIVDYLQHQNMNAMIVLGAYRRGRLSRLFRESMADHLLQHVRMPLFIAHNKS